MNNPYLRFLDQGDFTVLLFHGVVEKSDYQIRNYTRKHLRSDYFKKIIIDFLNSAEAVSMDQVVAHSIERKPFKRKAFAVTFDDGFENNLSVAAPILQDLGVPSAFYVSTALIEENGMSWIDKIEFLFEKKQKGKLRLPWSDELFVFSSPEEAIKILSMIRERVKSDVEINPEKFVASVFEQFEEPVIESNSDPLDLKLNWNQVRELSENPLFTIGGHSHHHLNLAFLSESDLKWQLATSLRLLQEKAAIHTRHYAYPEGLAHCYSSKVIEELRALGIICSPTAIEGANKTGADLFELRRVIVV